MTAADRINISGWLALDKPEDISSARAVAEVRKIFNAKKAGHAGTLDPLATGLLPIALGEATKTASFLTDGEKIYRFTVRFGLGTDSDDRKGNIIASSEVRPSDEQIQAQLHHFIGAIDQIPPIFSALKKDGRRAYQRARAGESFALAPRRVRINDLRLLCRRDRDHAVMEMRCQKGVYVRALARDLGEKLACPAHIAQLRRLAVAPLGEADMIVLDKIKKIGHSASVSGRQRLDALLLPLETALEGLSKIMISSEQADLLRQGQAVPLKQDAKNAGLVAAQRVLAMMPDHAVALCRLKEKMIAPERVFNVQHIKNI